MSFNFKLCGTDEITKDEWDLITSGFNQSFDRDYPKEHFKNYYSSSHLGCSFHVIVSEAETGHFVGHTSIFPYSYLNSKNEKLLAGLSGGSFIIEKYRKNLLVFRDAYSALRDYCRLQDMKFIIGVPNQNLFGYSTTVLSFKHILDLEYHVLPVTLKAVSDKLSFFKSIYKFCLQAFLLAVLFLSKKSNQLERDNGIRLFLDDKFYSRRFRKDYKFYSYKNIEGVYKTFDENGLSITYIFDFKTHGHRDSYSLTKLLIHILKSENTDVISFVGIMKFRTFSLVKLSPKMAPKRLPLIVDILDYENETELLTPESWNFSLMNFDVR